MRSASIAVLLAVSATALRTPSAQPRTVPAAATEHVASCGRRAALLSGAAAALGAQSPALAAPLNAGSWAEHKGSFDGNFFRDFTTSPEGFQYKFVADGEGERPERLQKVYVDYTGYLMDGTKFDSSYDKGEAFGFRLGKGKVIRGWESIAAGMPVGKKVVVKIPPDYAYGKKGTPGGPIPPDAPLVFYMEMVRFGNIKGDKPRLGSIMADS